MSFTFSSICCQFFFCGMVEVLSIHQGWVWVRNHDLVSPSLRLHLTFLFSHTVKWDISTGINLEIFSFHQYHLWAYNFNCLYSTNLFLNCICNFLLAQSVGKISPHLPHTTHWVLYMDPLLEPNRKRGSKYQLKFYKKLQAIKKQRAEKYQLCEIYIHTIGQALCNTDIDSDNHYFWDKDNYDGIPVFTGPDEHDDWIDAGDDEPPLDQAYLDHISKEVVDECLKRDRPKGVSPNISMISKN